jgi:hypothetical protein
MAKTSNKSKGRAAANKKKNIIKKNSSKKDVESK